MANQDHDDTAAIHRSLAATLDFSETEALLTSVREGTEDAARKLWHLYHRGVELTLGRITRQESRPSVRSKLDAELDDLVNEVMFRAHTAIVAGEFTYRGRESVQAWLHTLARNLIEDRRRYWAVRPEAPIPALSHTDTEWLQVVHGTRAGPPTEVAQRERWHHLHRAIAHLEPDHQLIVESRFFYGLPWKAVGAQLDKSADTARVTFESKIARGLGLALKIVEREGR